MPFSCWDCGVSKAGSAFSTAQMKKKASDRRCEQCIAKDPNKRKPTVAAASSSRANPWAIGPSSNAGASSSQSALPQAAAAEPEALAMMQPEAPPPERPTTDQQPLQPVSTASPAQAAQAAPAAALPSPASSSAPAPPPAPPPAPKEPDAGLGVCTAAEMQKHQDLLLRRNESASAWMVRPVAWLLHCLSAALRVSFDFARWKEKQEEVRSAQPTITSALGQNIKREPDAEQFPPAIGGAGQACFAVTTVASPTPDALADLDAWCHNPNASPRNILPKRDEYMLGDTLASEGFKCIFVDPLMVGCEYAACPKCGSMNTERVLTKSGDIMFSIMVGEEQSPYHKDGATVGTVGLTKVAGRSRTDVSGSIWQCKEIGCPAKFSCCHPESARHMPQQALRLSLPISFEVAEARDHFLIDKRFLREFQGHARVSSACAATFVKGVCDGEGEDFEVRLCRRHPVRTGLFTPGAVNIGPRSSPLPPWRRVCTGLIHAESCE